MPRIGHRLTELRRRRRLSIRELAVRSGVSHSTISLIERDQISPSVDTLAAIVDALGSTVVGFLTDVSGQGAVSPFYPCANLVEIGRNDHVSYRVVGFDHPHRQMLILSETYPAGAATGEPITHVAQEGGVVVKGAIQVTVDGQSRVLEEGDGYYFDSRLPHAFTNVHDGESRIVSAITPPTY